MSENLASNAMNGIENAKQAFKNMLKDKNKWLMLYLILVIIFIVWLLFWYVRNKIMLKDTNNLNMINNLSYIGGSRISNINSANANLDKLLYIIHLKLAHRYRNRNTTDDNRDAGDRGENMVDHSGGGTSVKKRQKKKRRKKSVGRRSQIPNQGADASNITSHSNRRLFRIDK